MIQCVHCGQQVAPDTAFCPNCGKPPAPPPKKSNAVVWVFAIGCGLFALIAIIGIVAAIFIPNFLDALQRAKQKRTVADMREIGTAWMSWMTDHIDDPETSLSEYPSVDELAGVLEGEYLQQMPRTDGWKHPFEFWIARDLRDTPTMYIRSAGRDGVFETNDLFREDPFDPYEYDRDIVWADGVFTHYPQANR